MNLLHIKIDRKVAQGYSGVSPQQVRLLDSGSLENPFRSSAGAQAGSRSGSLGSRLRFLDYENAPIIRSEGEVTNCDLTQRLRASRDQVWMWE